MFNRALLEKIDNKLSSFEVAIYKLELKIDGLEKSLNQAMGISETATNTNRANYDQLLELQQKLDSQVGEVISRPVEIPDADHR